jgi:hypothetical protein
MEFQELSVTFSDIVSLSHVGLETEKSSHEVDLADLIMTAPCSR